MPAKPTDITSLLDERNNPPMRCLPNTAGWVPDGPCVAYHDDGSVLLEITYRQGVAHGPYRDFWQNGRVSMTGQYAEGMQEGEWCLYDRDTGESREVLRFVAGREITGNDPYSGQSR